MHLPTNMYALLFGIIVGIAFTAFGLRAPAPDQLSAILGIVGIYLGPIIYKFFLG